MPLGKSICRRDLAFSTARTIMLFSEYESKLENLKRETLTREFFKEFVRAWGLRRTIGKGEDKLERVRELLICRDLELIKNGDAKTVDEIADCYKHAGLSAKSGGKRESFRKARSLVSKIAFLAKPAVFVPYDTYARDGLNCVEGGKKMVEKDISRMDMSII